MIALTMQGNRIKSFFTTEDTEAQRKYTDSRRTRKHKRHKDIEFSVYSINSAHSVVKVLLLPYFDAIDLADYAQLPRVCTCGALTQPVCPANVT